jgi:hypothetical protein
MRKQAIAFLLSGAIAKTVVIRIYTSAMATIVEFRGILYTENVRNICCIPAAILIYSFAKLFHIPITIVDNPVDSSFYANTGI